MTGYWHLSVRPSVCLCLSVCLKLCSVAKQYHSNITYHIVDLKRQNLLHRQAKLKVVMRSVSDDAVWKRLVEKPRFELLAKGVFRLVRCYIFRHTSYSKSV